VDLVHPVLFDACTSNAFVTGWLVLTISIAAERWGQDPVPRSVVAR
jgi:hypothetical protein